MNDAFYGLDSTFWFKLIIIVAITVITLAGTDMILSKLFKVEKKQAKYYSSKFVNNLHKTLDWTIRIIFILSIFISLIILNAQMPEGPIVLPWYLLFAMLGASELLRAIIQWKYVTNRKVYVFTFTRLCCWAVLFALIIRFISSDMI
ncbi:DUF4181 domain-containing protein [Oceanobacillus alkalisoli]|uniref:DUF4181 domain-containing protein n=1 Tax=Oceanobacillus alkalisoli TaxID=2925113 RepID=UPI001EE428FC|nr:DUF4181 domain-containing protein [Oceanobacillus alkalisoli]MCG5105309.1 DUF4181 domain-containing protein [Oceanobacillus alkalisoli]